MVVGCPSTSSPHPGDALRGEGRESAASPGRFVESLDRPSRRTILGRRRAAAQRVFQHHTRMGSGSSGANQCVSSTPRKDPTHCRRVSLPSLAYLNAEKMSSSTIHFRPLDGAEDGTACPV